MIIVDAHQDLAWNMLTFGRDYTLSAHETRQREQGTPIATYNGDTLLGWQEYQQGRVAVVFSTLFATPLRRKLGGWDVLCYADERQARSLYRKQLTAYEELVEKNPDKFSLIQTQADLQTLLQDWANDPEATHPVGLVVLMEGAEAIREPEELEEWWQAGVRIVGPAWAGNRYCGGTDEPGPLTTAGYALLEAMAACGFMLDISHMDEKAALQALDTYPGQVIATHANALRLLKDSNTNRHLSDRVIRGLLERDGVIGVMPFNSFLKVDWKRREEVSLRHLVAHIDLICQMAGDARHVGLGTDFDGGFGWQATPVEIETIADLQKLAGLLGEAGYPEDAIAAILGENWITCLKKNLPESL